MQKNIVKKRKLHRRAGGWLSFFRHRHPDFHTIEEARNKAPRSRNGKNSTLSFKNFRLARKSLLPVLIAFVLLFQTGASSQASWIDDWMTQKTSTNPGYFEGQKRGYFNGGSFQGRWKQSSDNLFTVQLPRIKSGCGGIDVSMGGFSFLDFDYLVQKLQRILQNAAGFAFHLGLKVLSQEAGSTLEWVEGVSDALNHIQLDDCKTGKAMVAYLGDAISPDSRFSKEFQSIEGDWKDSLGIGTLYDKFKTETKSDSGDTSTKTDNIQSMTSGCPADVRDLFYNPSFLAGLGSKISLDSNLLPLVRGIIGDIQIDISSGAPFATLIASCAQNEPDSLDQILNGTVAVRDSVSSSCANVSNVNGNIRDRIATIMASIAAKYKSRSQLSADEQLFVDTNPLDIALVLKTAAGTSQEATIIAQLGEISAKAYTYNLLMDLYGRVYYALGVYSNIVSAKKGGTSDNTCYSELLEDVVSKANTLKPKLDTLVTHTKAEYAKILSETTSVYNIVGKLKEFNSLAQNEVARVSGTAAARAVR